MNICIVGNQSPSCTFKRNLKPKLEIGCGYEGECKFKKEVK